MAVEILWTLLLGFAGVLGSADVNKVCQRINKTPSLQESYRCVIDGSVDYASIPKDAVHLEYHVKTQFVVDLHIPHLPKLETLKIFGDTQKNVISLSSATFSNVSTLNKLEIYEVTVQLGSLTFLHLTNLTDLHMSDTDLTELPVDSFAGLVNLRHLDLHKNQLTSLSSAVFDSCCSELQKLRLSNNFISQLDIQAHNNLNHVESLDLHDNRLNKLSHATFQHLPSLTDLNLSLNQLEAIEPRTFSSVPRLKKLYLDQTKLIYISSDAFAGLTSLIELNLDSNNLASLDSGMFHSLGNLTIDLTNNPWNCSAASQFFRYLRGMEKKRNLNISNRNLISCLTENTTHTGNKTETMKFNDFVETTSPCSDRKPTDTEIWIFVGVVIVSIIVLVLVISFLVFLLLRRGSCGKMYSLRDGERRAEFQSMESMRSIYRPCTTMCDSKLEDSRMEDSLVGSPTVGSPTIDDSQPGNHMMGNPMMENSMMGNTVMEDSGMQITINMESEDCTEDGDKDLRQTLMRCTSCASQKGAASLHRTLSNGFGMAPNCQWIATQY